MNPKLASLLCVLLMTVCARAICARAQEAAQAERADAVAGSERPKAWAQPLDMTGAPNLFKLNDSLYRCAQPTAEGMKNLKNHGIRTVVNLRSFHSDRDEIGNTGLAYEHIYMKAWHPEEKELVRFLKIVTDSKRTPVIVHCQHGADRTGLMCATYRVVVQGWTKEKAIEEMTRGGYGFHSVWTNIVNEVRQLDVDRLREKAGIK